MTRAAGCNDLPTTDPDGSDGKKESIDVGTHRFQLRIVVRHETAFIQQGAQPPGPAFNFAFAPAVGNNISDGSAVVNAGHWLVRAQSVEEVPEPSTLVLAGMAFANLLVLRRRRAT